MNASKGENKASAAKVSKRLDAIEITPFCATVAVRYAWAYLIVAVFARKYKDMASVYH